MTSTDRPSSPGNAEATIGDVEMVGDGQQDVQEDSKWATKAPMGHHIDDEGLEVQDIDQDRRAAMLRLDSDVEEQIATTSYMNELIEEAKKPERRFTLGDADNIKKLEEKVARQNEEGRPTSEPSKLNNKAHKRRHHRQQELLQHTGNMAQNGASKSNRSKQKKDMLPPSIIPGNTSSFIRKRFQHLGEDQLPLSRRAKEDYSTPRQRAIEEIEAKAEEETEQANTDAMVDPDGEKKLKRDKSSRKIKKNQLVVVQTSKKDLLRPRSEKPSQNEYTDYSSMRLQKKKERLLRENSQRLAAMEETDDQQVPIHHQQRQQQDQHQDDDAKTTAKEKVIIIPTKMDTTLLFTPEPTSPQVRENNNIKVVPVESKVRFTNGQNDGDAPAKPKEEPPTVDLDDPELFGSMKKKQQHQQDGTASDSPEHSYSSSSSKKKKRKRVRRVAGDSNATSAKILEEKLEEEERQLRAIRRIGTTDYHGDNEFIQKFVSQNTYFWTLSRVTNAPISSSLHSQPQQQVWKSHLALAQQELKNGNLKHAVTQVIKATFVAPSQLHPYLLRAQILAKMELWRQVICETTRVIELYAEQARHLFKEKVSSDSRVKAQRMHQSALFLRSRAFQQLNPPNLDFALRDLDLLLVDIVNVPAYIKFHAFLAKARVKVRYAKIGDPTEEERARMFEWALADIDMVEKGLETVSTLESHGEPGATAFPTKAAVHLQKAMVMLDLFSYTKKERHLDQYGASVTQAFQNHLRNPLVVHGLADVFSRHDKADMGLKFLRDIRKAAKSDAGSALKNESNKPAEDQREQPNGGNADALKLPLRKTSTRGGKSSRRVSMAPRPPASSTRRTSTSSRRPTFTGRATAVSSKKANVDGGKESRLVEFETLKQEGKLLSAKGDYQKAFRAWLEALTIIPRDPETTCLLAEAYHGSGQLKKALDTISILGVKGTSKSSSFIEKHGNHISTLLRRIRFSIYLSQNNHAMALQDLEKLVPENQDSESRLGGTAERSLEPQDVLYCSMKLAHLKVFSFNDAAGAMDITERLLDLGAMKTYSKTLAPELHARVVFVRAMALAKMSRFEEAARCFSQIMFQQPSAKEWYLLRSWCLSHVPAKVEKAVSDLERYQLLHRGDEKAVFREGLLLLLKNEDLGQAFKIFVQCLREAPETDILKLIFECIRLLIKDSTSNKTFVDYKPILNTLCNETLQVCHDSKSIYEIAQCYHSMGSFDEAIKYYDKSMSLGQFNKFGSNFSKLDICNARGAAKVKQIGIGTSQLSLKQFESALQDFSQCGLEDVTALLNRAEIYSRGGRKRQALDMIGKCIQLQPQAANLRVKQGIILAEIGRYGDAINAFDVAIHFGDCVLEAWFNRGWVYQRLGSYQRALTAYEKVLTMDPTSVPTYLNRGIIFVQIQQPNEAIRHFHKAEAYLNEWKDKDTYPDSHLHLLEAHCYVMLGQIDKAKQIMNRFNGDKTDHDLILSSAAIWTLHGKYSQFAALGNREVVRSEKLCKNESDMHQIKQVRRMVHMTVFRDPTCLPARINLGICHLLEGRYEAALIIFKGAIEQASRSKKSTSLLLTAMAGYSHVYLLMDDPFKAYLCLTALNKFAARVLKRQDNTSERNIDFLLSWAVTNHALGNLEVAHGIYEKSIFPLLEENSMAWHEAHLLSGSLCLRVRFADAAAEHLDHVLHKFSNHVIARVNRAITYTLKEDFRSALNLLASIEPLRTRFFFLFNRATLFAFHKDGPQAQRDCDTALAKYPGNVMFTLLRAFALLAQNRNKNALKDFEHVLTVNDRLINNLSLA